MSKKTGVTIVIPTFNRNVMLNRLIKSLSSATKNVNELEIIVVDNANNSDTKKNLHKNYKNLNIKIINTEFNVYSGGARQLGLDNASNDTIFFVDDDNVLGANCIDLLKKYINSSKIVTMVAPLMCYYDNKDVIWSGGGRISKLGQISYIYSQIKRDRISNSIIEKVDFFPNAFMIVKSRLAGVSFDAKDLPHNWNEPAFCFYAKKKGKLVTLADAVIYHDINYRGKITRLGVNQTYDQARSRIIYRKKYMNDLFSWFTFFLIVLPVSSFYYFKKILFQKDISKHNLFFSYVKGTIDGIKFQDNA